MIIDRRTGGFIAAGLLVVGCFIVFLGVSGWLFWHSQSGITKPDASQHIVQNRDPTKQQNNANSSEIDNIPKQEPQAFIEIPEWEIRFTAPETLRNQLSYNIQTQAVRDFGGPSRVEIFVQSVQSSTLKCSEIETSEHMPIVSFYRIPQRVNSVPDETSFKTILDQQYYFAPTACGEAIARSDSLALKKLLADALSAISMSLEYSRPQ